jgi:hypothetical protein
MSRVYSEDAYCLGLLYVYTYSNEKQKMAKLDDLKEFHNKIEQNLEDMENEDLYDSLCMYSTMIYNNNESIYFSSSDKEGNIFYILKPNFDKDRAMLMYFGWLPPRVLFASQMNNALASLGLAKKEDKMAMNEKEQKTKKLI